MSSFFGGRQNAEQPTDRVVVVGTSAPNRFRTTSSVLVFFHKHRIINKFEVQQCSIHGNGEIMLRFGTTFAGQLFALKLQTSEAASRYFQINHCSFAELESSQFIVLNLCAQKRSRDGQASNNIIRRWRGEGVMDCDADKRQFHFYLFKQSDAEQYLRLTMDDKIVEQVSIVHNEFSAGIKIEVNGPPKCESHRHVQLLAMDRRRASSSSSSDDAKQTAVDDDEEEDKNKSGSGSKQQTVCPKLLLTGSCDVKKCTFSHHIRSGDADDACLGNSDTLWVRAQVRSAHDADLVDNDKEEDDDNVHSNAPTRRRPPQPQPRLRQAATAAAGAAGEGEAWIAAAHSTFIQPKHKRYILDKASTELEDAEYIPWTYEYDAERDTNMSSLLKFLGQCWVFCIEFVRVKQVPERFVNGIRQMRGIHPRNIQQLSTDYEASYPMPSIFTIGMSQNSGKNNQSQPEAEAAATGSEQIYYHPPFAYLNSRKSSHLRLKRHLHDLNHQQHHDVAFALEACLHNFPPVFIAEDLIATDTHNDHRGDLHRHHHNDVHVLPDPDIFFKCLTQEIASNEGDVVWQSLLHCAKCDDYRVDRSTVSEDVEMSANEATQKLHILPALELFYKSLEWAQASRRTLKQKQNGNTHADHVWIKRVSVTPLRLSLDIGEEESTRMFRFKQYAPPTDFCRIEFADEHQQVRSMAKEYFSARSTGRRRAYKILQQGLCIAGVVYQFLFFGNKQVRDAKAWMKAELIAGFDANRVRADIARLSQERNIGKKMDRFHLFMSKGTPANIYGEADIETIDDEYARDDKLLTDGCSLILESEMKRAFPIHVASMLVRIGGAKTQMMTASGALMEALILRDIERKQQNNINMRNLAPKIILTRSCLKFMTDTQKQLEIKKCARALPCMMNREFINQCIFHRIAEHQPDALQFINHADSEESASDSNHNHNQQQTKLLQSAVNFKLSPHTKRRITDLLLRYQRAFSDQLVKMENICEVQMERLKEMKQRYGARSIYIRPASSEEQRAFFETLLFLSSRLHVEEAFLARLTQQVNAGHSDCGKRLNFKDVSDLSALLTRLWGGLKSKFKIQLQWPSSRLAGIADFQFKLKEFEVFYKVRIPPFYDWKCTACGQQGIKYWNERCDNAQCGAAHPVYHVHRGPIGLLKNPCLHPGSYRVFEAVYDADLDAMFDGEVLVFSASTEHCATSQVHKLSGGDLDGDDFLCVVQQDLLPLGNDVVKCMEYDADKPKLTAAKYVDISICVEYWLNYQINDCVGIIAELHESFSDGELGVASPQCLELAVAHSKAVDYAKTGVAAKIPGIVGNISGTKYPHHMGKHQSLSYKSTSIKGVLYNSVRIPNRLWRDKEFRKLYNLRQMTHAHESHHGGVPGRSTDYEAQHPLQPQLSNREKLRERLNKGCTICGITHFHSVHVMNQHKDDPTHKKNKQMARDKAMLESIKNAKINAQYQTHVSVDDGTTPAAPLYRSPPQSQQQQQPPPPLPPQRQPPQTHYKRQLQQQPPPQQHHHHPPQPQPQHQHHHHHHHPQQEPPPQPPPRQMMQLRPIPPRPQPQPQPFAQKPPQLPQIPPQPQPQAQPQVQVQQWMDVNVYPFDNRDAQIRQCKEMALGLGFPASNVDAEMQIFLDVLKVSGHSLTPSCFLNYLCEITANT